MLLFPGYIHAQYLDFLSLGYNTLITKINNEEYRDTFININGYSQYTIRSHTYRGETNHGLTFLYESELDRCFELGLFGYFNPEQYNRNYYEKKTTDTGIKQFVEYSYYIGYGISEISTKTYRFNNEGFIENITEHHDAGYWNTSERIVPEDNGIMLYFRNAGETRKYYNIQEKEQLDFFLNIFVKNIFQMLNFRFVGGNNRGRNQLDIYRTDYENLRNSMEYKPVIVDILENMTKRELAIIRNSLYANKNYNFRAEEWRTFFQNYYNSNYRGFLAEQDVLNTFSDNEKWLLNLILEFERNIQ